MAGVRVKDDHRALTALVDIDAPQRVVVRWDGDRMPTAEMGLGPQA
jgi:hypothetical protein